MITTTTAVMILGCRSQLLPDDATGALGKDNKYAVACNVGLV